jgi:hypothetical protein
MPRKRVGPDQVPKTPVDGEGLIGDIVAFINRYVVVPRDATLVMALWVIHTYVFEAARYTPYVYIKSPTRGCGKSRLLDVLALLVARPILAADTTVAALFRSIEEPKPTLLLDEQDGLRRGTRESGEEMRKILNAGFQRGRTVRRCVAVGRNQQVVAFDVFCPKALAGIGDLPDTVMDRAFIVELERKRSSEPVQRLDRTAEALAAPLRDLNVRWAEANVSRLEGAAPPLPDELDDRAQDIAEPLLAIADLAGGLRPREAREAIVGLRRAAQAQDGDRRVDLLGDIRGVFEAAGEERQFFTSSELVEELIQDESSVWREARRGEPITPTWLAYQLKHFHIRPHPRKVAGVQARGYTRTQFTEDFERYLPAEPAADAYDDSAPAAPKSNPFRSVRDPKVPKPRPS